LRERKQQQDFESSRYLENKMPSSSSQTPRRVSTPILPVHHAGSSARANGNTGSSVPEEEIVFAASDQYNGFPLVQSMMATEARRTAALTREGSKQMKYCKSNAGWLRSIFVLEGRALDRIFLPWLIVTLNAVAWAVVYDRTGIRENNGNNGLQDDTWAFVEEAVQESSSVEIIRRNYIEGALELILTTTMAFLLVFRLNRTATRFWMARASWGMIVAKCRGMVGSILLHGAHDPHHRDQAVKYIAAYSIATMNHMRGLDSINPKTVEGILTKSELEDVNVAKHPPLHVADTIRFHLAELLGPTSVAMISGGDVDGGLSGRDAARSIALSDFRAKQLLSLEVQVNALIDEMGAMERIKATPLPLVYVTHLRTWLMLFLLTLPYFWEPALGYAIIPVECLAAFALLGLEGAASEVEAPFRKDRTNHLDMDSYCLTVLSNILQQAQDDAQRRIKVAKTT
jgi:putative membrane protein